MANDLVAGYAGALVAVASAEGDLTVIEDELFKFVQAFRKNDDLQATLVDSTLPVSRRQQVVEDLLGEQANRTSLAILCMVVAAERANHLPAIVDTFIELGAATRNKTVATVRSAIELTSEQIDRLTSALNSATGKDVELKVVIDSSVLGGVVTEIGNDIIDGSVRRRLGQLRESFR